MFNFILLWLLTTPLAAAKQYKRLTQSYDKQTYIGSSNSLCSERYTCDLIKNCGLFNHENVTFIKSTVWGKNQTKLVSKCKDVVYKNYNQPYDDFSGMMQPTEFRPSDSDSKDELISSLSLKNETIEYVDGLINKSTWGFHWGTDQFGNSSKCGVYVHGGSWYYNTPASASYAPFVAMLSQRLKMPILAVDYPLITRKTRYQGTYSSIMAIINAAIEAMPCENVILIGDSSGGGSVASAVLAGTNRRKNIYGAILFSPWLDLKCNTSSYVSNQFFQDGNCREGRYCIYRNARRKHTCICTKRYGVSRIG